MGRAQPLLIVFLVVVSIGIVPGIAIADDEYPEWGECEAAPVLDSDTYSGVFNSPEDVDTIAFNLRKGDYVSFQLLVEEGEENSGVDLGTANDPDFSITDVENAEYWQEDWPGIGENIDIEGGGIPAYWTYWGEEEGETRHCIHLETGQNGASVGDVPLDWELQMAVNGELSENPPDDTQGNVDVPGVDQEVVDAAAGGDGQIDRQDILDVVQAYVNDEPIGDGVSLSRSDVLNLVEYYITS